MSDEEVLFLSACAISLFLSVLISGSIFNEAPSWDRKKEAIIFLTSFLWGPFAWIGVVGACLFLSVASPFVAIIGGCLLLKEAIQSIRQKNE